MSFPRYPKYKDSGVEWLGMVPEHWKVTQLKRVVNPDRQITYGIVQAGPHVPDGVPYIRPADMTDEQGVAAPDEVMRTSLEIVSAYSRSTIRTGDLVCSIGPSFGKVMVTPEWLDGANLTQGTARIAVHPPHNARYLFWTLRSPLSVAQWESSVGGATFRALNLGPLAETTIPVPSATEQTAIAEFLDRETGKIDELVGEQRRLMELLKEKRQAVISHAVTRGLNPTAPLKPSGIEWLGDVPAHWEVIRIGRRIELQRGVDITKDEQNPGSVPVVSSGGIASFHDNPLVSGPGVVVGRKGTAGAIYYIDCDYWPHDTTLYVKEFHGNNPRFVFYKLHSMDLASYDTGSSNPTINRNLIHPVVVSWPPTSEQRVIADFLDAELAKFDTLTAEAQRAIDLLQERRTALISAAVTGQIDVRTVA